MNIIHNGRKLVYHYTSTSTLLKILDKIEDDHLVFYASGISGLNDSSEFIYGFKQFRRLLPSIEKRVEELEQNLRLSIIAKKIEDSIIAEKLNERFTDILIKECRTPFVLSTSSNGDNIPMWAMYGDAGRGVSIGLDISNMYVPIKKEDGSMLFDFTKYDSNEPHALKVVHNLSLKHPAILLSISTYKQYVEEVKSLSNVADILRLQLIALFEMSVYAAALTKHPAFSFENEWRIVRTASCLSQLNFRVNSHGSVIPYINIKLPVNCFKKLYIGPCCENSYQKEIVEKMLSNKGLQHCKVIKSRVPYKG